MKVKSHPNVVFLKNQSHLSNRLFTLSIFLFCFSLIFIPQTSFAGTGGSAEFQSMLDTIQGYVTGIPSLIMLLLGLAYSIFIMLTKHTIIPFVMVILAAILLSTGPAMLGSLVSATI